MFFDWEYHEPKVYISHRFSKGDIAFVQNRYRGMESLRSAAGKLIALPKTLTFFGKYKR